MTRTDQLPRFEARLLDALLEVADEARLHPAPQRARPAAVTRDWRVAVAVAAAAALLAVAPAVVDPRRDGARAFAVTTGEDGLIEILRMDDADAADGDLLEADLRAVGLDAEVTMIPVSPSLVGTLISFDVAPHGAALGAGHDIPAGVLTDDPETFLTIDPAVFTGELALHIGAPAAPGETYQVAGSVFGPGELLDGLHCVLGDEVTSAELARYEQRTGARFAWQRVRAVRSDQPQQDDVTWDMDLDAVEQRPEGRVLTLDTWTDSVLTVGVLPEGETLPAESARPLAELEWEQPCGPEQVARWR